MRLVLYADTQGVSKVSIEYAMNGEQEIAHEILDALRLDVEKFSDAVKTAVAKMRAAEDRPFEAHAQF